MPVQRTRTSVYLDTFSLVGDVAKDPEAEEADEDLLVKFL